MTLKIRVITSFGGWFDMDQPENFDLPTYVAAIRGKNEAFLKRLPAMVDSEGNAIEIDLAPARAV